MSDPNDLIVETRDVHRVLGGTGSASQVVLSAVSLTIPRGQFVALTGASGSGKSTLLYLLGALDRPSLGEIWLDGNEISTMDDDERAAFRNEKLGFVFQFHFLLGEFSVLENASLPMLRRGVPRDEAEDRAYEVLLLLGLAELWKRRPGQLSGGQQQRVSIARAVANDPAIILADEPTGNLDSKNGALVFEVFGELARTQGRTIVMVTHDQSFAERADRQIKLLDGRVVEDVKQRPHRASA
jgi:lipoprotein-releasing system ATP-binding protein